MSEVEKALSEEEWAEALSGKYLRGYNPDEYPAAWFATEDGGLVVATAADLVLRDKDRKALAALALHGQLFGFTWEDVRMLRIAADDAADDPYDSSAPGRLTDLANRIAALLPPRDEGTP